MRYAMTRARVVELAVAELGLSDAAKYWGAVLPGWSGPFPKYWCGGFALWCLRQAGLCDWIWEVSEVNAPKGHYGFLRHLPRTTDPRPGDIGYLDQPYQHHFIVEAADKHTLTSIDGNQGSPGVQRRHRAVNGQAAFYSIAALLPTSWDEETQPGPPRHPTLRLGAKQEAVKLLQQKLNQHGARLLTDGSFGPITALAVQSFQRRAGLDADGIVGPQTWTVLEKV